MILFLYNVPQVEATAKMVTSTAHSQFFVNLFEETANALQFTALPLLFDRQILLRDSYCSEWLLKMLRVFPVFLKVLYRDFSEATLMNYKPNFSLRHSTHKLWMCVLTNVQLAAHRLLNLKGVYVQFCILVSNWSKLWDTVTQIREQTIHSLSTLLGTDLHLLFFAVI